jgi:hypothetical protein
MKISAKSGKISVNIGKCRKNEKNTKIFIFFQFFKYLKHQQHQTGYSAQNLAPPRLWLKANLPLSPLLPKPHTSLAK